MKKLIAHRTFSYAVIIIAFVHLFLQYRAYSQSQIDSHVVSQNESETVAKRTIYLVGKAAIADYLWQHILRGTILALSNGFYKTGSLNASNLSLLYLSGPGVIQTTLPHSLEYMVLILNGRDEEKRKNAHEWLDFLINLNDLKKLGVVLLGDEGCANEWILKYMKRHGGIIDVLFVVYDWKLINHEDIYQWPLGVATYRGFPSSIEKDLAVGHRHNVCNFVGTLYPNSSRSQLQRIISAGDFPYKCPNIVRRRWVANESPATLYRYIDLLKTSIFTLCPVGKNSECYRIYEALSFGSIPIVEDTMTEGNCDSPLRLLKQHNAPFIFLKNWDSLNTTLSELSNPVLVEKLRRENTLWYAQFKLNLRNTFLQIIKHKFF